MERELWVVEEHLDVQGSGMLGVKRWEPLSWCAYPSPGSAQGAMEAWERSEQRKRYGGLRVVRYAPVEE